MHYNFVMLILDTFSMMVLHQQKALLYRQSEKKRGAKNGKKNLNVKPQNLKQKRNQTTNGGSRRSSIYKGVTRHRWTDRFEAYLWDKSSWNNIQNKKGKQG